MVDTTPPRNDLQVVVTNLHWNYTGVTSTNLMVAPRLAKLCRVGWLGFHAPEGLAQLSLWDLLKLRSRTAPLVWHARRNNEMIAGVLLRALGWPLLLLFTSAAQRHHSWITRWLIRQMDAIIATSPASASYLQRAATVITHGVDTDCYAPPDDRAAAFAESGLPGRYAIGCFGRVRAQKGTDLFVDAMIALLPRYPDASAAIVGAITADQKGFADRLKAKIATAGLQHRIVMTGELPRADVVRWYQRIAIYAFTSRNEGFGLTLIEAMAAGAALVATRAGAAELALAEGDAGMLVPTDDAAALIGALEPLMRDPALVAETGARGRARVLEHFGVDHEARKIADVYRRLLASGQG